MSRVLLFILILCAWGSNARVFAQKLINEFVVNRGSQAQRVYYLGEDRHMVIMGNQSSCYGEVVTFYNNGEKTKQYKFGGGYVGDVKFLPNGPELLFIGIPSDYSTMYGLIRAHYNFDGLEIKKEEISVSEVSPDHGFVHVSSCLIQDGVYFQTYNGKLYYSIKDLDESFVIEFASIAPNIPAEILVQQTGFDYYNPTYDVIVASDKTLYSFKRDGFSHQLIDSLSFDSIQLIKHYDRNKLVVVTKTKLITLDNQLNETGFRNLPVGFRPAGNENDTIYLRSDLADDGQQEFTRTHTIRGYDLNTFEEILEYNLQLAPFYVNDIFVKNDTAHVVGHSEIHTQSVVQMYQLNAPESIENEFIDIEVLNVELHSKSFSTFSIEMNALLDVTVRHNFGKITPALMSSVFVRWPFFCHVIHSSDYNESLSESQEITVRIPVVTYTYTISDAGDSIEFADACGLIFGVGTHMDIDMSNNWFCSGKIKFPFNTTSIEDNNIAEKWSISPNPASENILINLESLQHRAFNILVMDFQGNIVQKHALPAGAISQQIQTSGLIPGMYFIQLSDQKSGQLIDTKKLIKQ